MFILYTHLKGFFRNLKLQPFRIIINNRWQSFCVIPIPTDLMHFTWNIVQSHQVCKKKPLTLCALPIPFVAIQILRIGIPIQINAFFINHCLHSNAFNLNACTPHRVHTSYALRTQNKWYMIHQRNNRIL